MVMVLAGAGGRVEGGFLYLSQFSAFPFTHGHDARMCGGVKRCLPVLGDSGTGSLLPTWLSVAVKALGTHDSGHLSASCAQCVPPPPPCSMCGPNHGILGRGFPRNTNL